MAKKWAPNDGTFHLGINMAGAVSAGAYTAGVLDFLTEALEQWYAAKQWPNFAVPLHDVSIDVFSGASAGGMCAAIAAVMIQGEFEHVRNPSDASVTGTTNKFYESWVNKIDIEYLLQNNDLSKGQPVISLLDSTIIDEIADYALTPGPANGRPYFSKSLTLFLTLTNVRGAPFSFNGTADGSAEEDIAYYADRLQFETVAAGAEPLARAAKPLPLGTSGGAWSLLKDAAKATGAFPLFLAPRKIDRKAEDYWYSPWAPISETAPDSFPPHWTLHKPDTFTTLNVDGGVTDNDPFELAHDYLAIHNPAAALDPRTGQLANPRSPEEANCAVLTVAPFPADDIFNPDYNFDKNSSLAGMLPNLFTALISQSRFLGESLSAVLSRESFSRFVLAPSDFAHPNTEALQCGLLSAFGGFFERGFRAHDYQLGRRNCQKFLKDHFRLSIANPIIESGLAKLDADSRAAVMQGFAQGGSMPLIPLCGTARDEVLAPARATITPARVAQIVTWIDSRLQAVAKSLLNPVGHVAAEFLISTLVRPKLKELLDEKLAAVISR